MKPEEAAVPEVRVVDRRWWARGEAPATTDEPAARKPSYVEDLERRLADTTAQLQTALGEHRRSQDEFEQIKARIRRDVGKEVERARRAVLTEILDVGDNLDRALSAAGDTAPNPAVERLARGVELVRAQFRAKLEGLGVTCVPALGQPFDARVHEAVSTAPVEDASQDGTVVAVVKDGYAIGDELLRPAAVVVGAHTPAAADS
jgi:molecular chaperone GrpE